MDESNFENVMLYFFTKLFQLSVFFVLCQIVTVWFSKTLMFILFDLSTFP